MARRNSAELVDLVEELRSLPNETEWVEFKCSYAETSMIGEYISALANSATLNGKPFGYVVWGIDNDTHEIVGTSFKPSQTKGKGNEDLEPWLLRNLTPQIHFDLRELDIDGRRVVLLQIACAHGQPVQFLGVEYIRVGSYKKRLSTCPEKARALWRLFDETPFELAPAAEGVATTEVLGLLNVSAYFELQDLPVPRTPEKQLAPMAKDEMLKPDGGRWVISNLGALLFARRLADFPSVRRKTTRVVGYRGTSRTDSAQEVEEPQGYAVSFEETIGRIARMLPPNEIIGKAIRRDVRLYPEPAIRELVPNALIHQDFTIPGAGPMIEVFSDRMEITNPGTPLVDTRRWLDSPPRSRNERLASFMRRIGMCEERGSGVDKVVFQTELYQLPAPVFEEAGASSTRAILFAPKPLTKMQRDERIRACYLHACLKWVNKDYLTNSSIRERFGVSKSNSPMASRYIREALDAEAIKPDDPDAAPKHMRYVPIWA